MGKWLVILCLAFALGFGSGLLYVAATGGWYRWYLWDAPQGQMQVELDRRLGEGCEPVDISGDGSIFFKCPRFKLGE